MTHDGDKPYLKPYREAVRAHGPGFAATLWASPEGQRQRFDVMIDLVDFSGLCILDIGCGTGDFAQHLVDRNIAFKRYIGLDAVPDVITAAMARKIPRAEFAVCDVLADPRCLADWPHDYACISGALNTMEESHARDLVRAAFSAAASGIVFNFLSNRAHPTWMSRDLGPSTRFNTVAWLDWAFTLSSRVAFTQAYMDGHDATILIKHDTP